MRRVSRRYGLVGRAHGVPGGVQLRRKLLEHGATAKERAPYQPAHEERVALHKSACILPPARYPLVGGLEVGMRVLHLVIR